MSGCLFCKPMSPGKYPIDPDALCPRHLETSGLGPYLRTHPDGHCTDTCGCRFITLEELDHELAQSESERE